jgi:hypothetical protein
MRVNHKTRAREAIGKHSCAVTNRKNGTRLVPGKLLSSIVNGVVHYADETSNQVGLRHLESLAYQCFIARAARNGNRTTGDECAEPESEGIAIRVAVLQSFDLCVAFWIATLSPISFRIRSYGWKLYR